MLVVSEELLDFEEMTLKRKALISLIIILISFFAYQVYLFNKYEGNLVVYISNYTYSNGNNAPINYALYIDDKLYQEGKLGNIGFDSFLLVPIKDFSGKKSIRIELNNKTIERISTQNLLVNFIVFEIYNSNLDSEKTEIHEFKIVYYKKLTPIILE